jgi:hypothetical protein
MSTPTPARPNTHRYFRTVVEVRAFLPEEALPEDELQTYWIDATSALEGTDPVTGFFIPCTVLGSILADM